MSLFERTPWKYVTSEEEARTLLFSLAAGKLYFQNEETNEKLTVNYKTTSVGAGKGPAAGWSSSTTKDASGGDNVVVRPWKSFGSHVFPCRGYMFSLNASAGVVGTALNMAMTVGGVYVATFGILPVFGGVRFFGTGRALLPGAGVSGGLAHYWIDYSGP